MPALMWIAFWSSWMGVARVGRKRCRQSMVSSKTVALTPKSSFPKD